jgi:hypothetical protein
LGFAGNFIRNGQVPIIQRREEITQKAYGVEEVKVIIDTLGFVSAKERIFKKNYTQSMLLIMEFLWGLK